MQKKKIANLIMVLIIAALAAGGGFWAFSKGTPPLPRSARSTIYKN